jgi:L-2-hydroxyglutarate oxidase LhgO
MGTGKYQGSLNYDRSSCKSSFLSPFFFPHLLFQITHFGKHFLSFRKMPRKAPSNVSSAFHTQVAVIGAGVVGLAIARSLAQSGKEVLILDKASAICSETSSRNSEVIHAGIYYPQNSWKDKFCLQGRRLLYDYIQSRHISHKPCGKLIVATQPEQFQLDLPLLKQKAELNGVDNLKLVSRDDVKVMEPNVECFGALWSPSTGVLDSHSFFLSLLADAEEHGALLVLNTAVEDAAFVNDKICLKADDTWIECDQVINSAGLWASQVASIMHKHDNHYKSPKAFYAKGNYFRLQGKVPFRHLIYPVPEPGGLGVHATIDWSGNAVKFGPDVEWMDPSTTKDPSQISLDIDPQRGDKFYREVRKYWPDLQDNQLVPDYVGIRPKLNHPSQETFGFMDYRIDGPETHGIHGLIHLFGIESPGLTSSMAIGEHINNIVTNR